MPERNFSMVEYFNRRAKSLAPKYRFSGKSQEDFQRWQQALLAELTVALGPEPERVDLNPQVEWEKEENGLICDNCRLIYEIRDDIPIMLIDEARKID